MNKHSKIIESTKGINKLCLTAVSLSSFKLFNLNTNKNKIKLYRTFFKNDLKSDFYQPISKLCIK